MQGRTSKFNECHGMRMFRINVVALSFRYVYVTVLVLLVKGQRQVHEFLLILLSLNAVVQPDIHSDR